MIPNYKWFRGYGFSYTKSSSKTASKKKKIVILFWIPLVQLLCFTNLADISATFIWKYINL